MLRFEWNALKVGDAVLVHDDSSIPFDLRAGVVCMVDTRRDRSNDVGIRVEPSGDLVRPRRHAVHRAPLDRWFECWRCEETQRLARTA